MTAAAAKSEKQQMLLDNSKVDNRGVHNDAALATADAAVAAGVRSANPEQRRTSEMLVQELKHWQRQHHRGAAAAAAAPSESDASSVSDVSIEMVDDDDEGHGRRLAGFLLQQQHQDTEGEQQYSMDFSSSVDALNSSGRTGLADGSAVAAAAAAAGSACSHVEEGQAAAGDMHPEQQRRHPGF